MEAPTPSSRVDGVSAASAAAEPEHGVRAITITVDGRPARVFVGGHGEHLLLVHGGWGGAATHWRSVWGPLAERFHVIAPDLPGIGDPAAPPLESVGAYARWVRTLLDALDVRRAYCAGNSFGVSVVSRFALDHPDRCAGLICVNGIPMPETPEILRWLGERRLGRRLLRMIEKQVAYKPAALERAFYDPANVPDEIRALLQEKWPPQVDAMAQVLVQGGGPKDEYQVDSLLVWGEDDHLAGTGKRAVRRLKASLPRSTIAWIPRAGHMPQVENPDAFIDALVSFVAKGAAPPGVTHA